MDSYDNDWLFLDDDLFCVWRDEYLFEQRNLTEADTYAVEAVQSKPISDRRY